MRYTITEPDETVEIRVTETGDRAAQLLTSMQECQQGRCACPTDQYERLEGMDVHSGNDAITLTLRPRAGERLDVNELRRCLDYTVAKAQPE